MIVMGGIIGAGIFVNPSVVARQVHTPILILGAWLVGGVIALIGAFVAALMMAYVLAIFIGFAQAKTIFQGVTIGLWSWVGFVAAPTLSNYLFSGWSRDLYLINNSYYLVSLLVMGAVLAMWT